LDWVGGGRDAQETQNPNRIFRSTQYAAPIAAQAGIAASKVE